MFDAQRTKRIFLLLGHPDKETFNGQLADHYEKGALEAGHEVRRMNIGDLAFDPILHFGYKMRQEFEPDLVRVQDNILWAEHIVLVYPTWWTGTPALFKGLFDRVWLPGFGFKYHKNRLLWKKLLTGRTARIIVTMDILPFFSRILYGNFVNSVRRGIFWFSGIWPVQVTKIGPVKTFSEEKRKRWKKKVFEIGKGE